MLNGSNAKLLKLEATIQDPNQKAMITAGKTKVATKITNVQQIAVTVATMAIAAHFNQAEQIKNSLTATNGEFKVALATYTKNKGPTDTIVKLYNTLLANVQTTVGLLTADLKTLDTMDQKEPSVIQWKKQGTTYSAPKTTNGSLQNLLQVYAILPLTRLGIQVQGLSDQPAATVKTTGPLQSK